MSRILTGGMFRAPTGLFAGRNGLFSGGRGGMASDKRLILPGANGDYASTPDSAALDIVGDIDLRADVALNDWTPTAVNSIVGKFISTGNQRSYLLSVLSTGVLTMSWSVDGITTISRNSTVAASTVAADRQRIWIRAVLDVDNGAAGHDVLFYTSIDGGSTWVQLGATVTTAGVTSIFSGTGLAQVSNFNAGAGNQPAAGRVWRAQIRNSVGALVADMWPRDWGSGTTWTSSITGEVWTLNGAATIGF